VDPQDQGEEDGAVVDLDSQRKGKCAVIKTSTRQVRNRSQYPSRQRRLLDGRNKFGPVCVLLHALTLLHLPSIYLAACILTSFQYAVLPTYTLLLPLVKITSDEYIVQHFKHSKKKFLYAIQFCK
jgi:hypothetical protein